MNTFVPDFGVVVPSTNGNMMKRESGANPEQARCCKLLQNLQTILNPLFNKEWEGRLKMKQVRKPAGIDKYNFILVERNRL